MGSLSIISVVQTFAKMILVVMMSVLTNVVSIHGDQEFPLVETDPLFEDEGTARLGFVQLNSGSSNFNTTLNLTGPILLGMGIAAATLFYAYFNAFQGGTDYNRYKRETNFDTMSIRSINDTMNILDSLSQLHSLDDTFSMMGIDSTTCQLRAVCEIYQSNDHHKGDNVSNLVREAIDALSANTEAEEWVAAAERGKKGENCDKVYKDCLDMKYKTRMFESIENSLR